MNLGLKMRRLHFAPPLMLGNDNMSITKLFNAVYQNGALDRMPGNSNSSAKNVISDNQGVG